MGRIGPALFFLFILSFQLVSAQSFTPWDAYLTNINTEIKNGQDARVELTILNNKETSDTFRLFIDTLSFSVSSETPSDYLSGMTIPQRDAKSAILSFRPFGKLEPGFYQIPITVNSVKEGNSRTVFTYVRIKSDSPEIRDYFAAVDRFLKIPAQADPRQPIPIEINLKNLNPKNITRLEIHLKSKLINKYIETTLKPLESKVLTTEVVLDPLTPPQNDSLQLLLVINNQSLYPVIKEPYSVLAYSEVIVAPADRSSGFLTKGSEQRVTNKGNIKRAYTLEQKTSIIDSIFTRAKPSSYTINKDDATYLAWDLSLVPNESITIYSTTSYVPLFVILLIIIFGVMAYFIFRSPIVISKEASVLATKEGGISKMKVLIHLKNRTGKSFDKVVIVDKIPNIVEIDKDDEVGTIKPTRVFSNPKEGTSVKWEIGGLEKFEERLITYKIKSKLTILGGINLPQAMVHYTTKGGKELIVKSNRLDVSL
ncbi:MAG TPA: hypothetical protein VJB90_03290 [Candidatus Nanoarchaeia archaeon]|nr:hypothetical protein [Candidatus Nanoarchaeia archaeon]